MIEDQDSGPTTAPFRFEARIGSGGRSPWPAAVFVVALVALAIAKPWEPPERRAATPRAGAARAVPSASAAASVAPSPTTGVAAVSSFCLEPGSWRTATVETWRDQTVRVWRALDPSAASGPTDPAIPIVPAVGTSVPAIGWCAPGIGELEPVGALDVHAWRVSSGRATPIRLRQVEPVGVVSPYGAMYGPPAMRIGNRAASWPDGIVVFRLVERASGLERWFGIEVRGTI